MLQIGRIIIIKASGYEVLCTPTTYDLLKSKFLFFSLLYHAFFSKICLFFSKRCQLACVTAFGFTLLFKCSLP